MADVFTIEIPSHVIEMSENNKMDFKGFIVWTISTHANYNQDAAGIRAAARLERKLESNDSTITVDAEDLQRLRVSVENPLGGYPIRPGVRMLPFVEAVVHAKKIE